MLFHLPGSAVQDMALGTGEAKLGSADPTVKAKVAAVRDEFVARVAALAPNPLRTTALPENVPTNWKVKMTAMSKLSEKLGSGKWS